MSVIHDANGERVYKLTGTSVMDQVNSGSTKAQAIFDDAVLYPNPYIVISQTGYTKHYYAGTERLATVIGGGGFGDMDAPIDKPTQRVFQWAMLQQIFILIIAMIILAGIAWNVWRLRN